ncbi:hypothetical protein [Geodermatophilus sp. URMC 62]|uniref:hypothetical protein n=1 Tax=Geodermatophilus sp. URMC 62 TaxID=3423414 RepID=UPI00406D3542
MFRDLTSGYVLTPAQRALAVEAARTADALVDVEALIAAANGAERRLCLAEARSQRLALTRILAALARPEEPAAARPKGGGRLAQLRALHGDRLGRTPPGSAS